MIVDLKDTIDEKNIDLTTLDEKNIDLNDTIDEKSVDLMIIHRP